MAKQEQKKRTVNILVPSPELERGVYANGVQMTVMKNELIVDFAFINKVTDTVTEGIQVARIILPHNVAVNLSKNMADYAKKITEEPEGK